MGKHLALGVAIGAALSGGFHRSIGSVKTKITKLGAEVKRLSSQRGLIERFISIHAAAWGAMAISRSVPWRNKFQS